MQGIYYLGSLVAVFIVIFGLVRQERDAAKRAKLKAREIDQPDF